MSFELWLCYFNEVENNVNIFQIWFENMQQENSFYPYAVILICY